MDSQYHNQQFSSELLLTVSALRELGFDQELTFSEMPNRMAMA